MKRIISVLAVLLAVSTLAFAGGRQAASGLVVEVFDRGTDGGRSNAANNAWTDWIKAKVKKDLNIDLTFFPVGRWSENTDIINLMASGSAPDLCYTYNGGMISSFRDQGGIADLAPHVERLLPDMKKLLGEDPALQGQDFIYRNRDPATGRMHSVMSYVVRLAQRNLFIRKDWLDRLGLPLPTTTQQFHDALVAFRDRDPGGVGRNNVIPFGQDSDARWGLSPIVNAYFDPRLTEREQWINGFSDRAIMMPGYKDGMRVMNQWFNEGLILRDFAILRSTDDYYNMLKTGVVGAFGGNFDIPWRTDYKIAEELAANVPGAQFVPVDCIQAPDGVTRKSIGDKAGLHIFVPAFAKNQEAALRYLNWLCIFENFNFLQIGTEGVNHSMVNGVPQILTTPANHQWFQNSQYNIDYTLPMNGIELLDLERNARVLALGYGNTPPDVIVNAINISVRNGRAPVVHQATTTLDGVYGQTLSDKADALIAQALAAPVANFDRIWDEGIQDYLRSGAQEIIDERTSLWPR